MFDRLKAVFGGSKSTQDFPEKVWALTVHLNPSGSRPMSPIEMADFAKRNSDDLGERTHTLYFGGGEEAKTIALFTLPDSALSFVRRLAEQRLQERQASNTVFGMVLLPRDSLYPTFMPVANLRIFLDSFLPEEREVTLDELKRYAKQY